MGFHYILNPPRIVWRCGVMCIIGLCNLLYVLWELQTLLHVCETSIGKPYK